VQHDPDFVVIGSGPNGLVAAVTLAERGHRVVVFESHPRRPGGALGSEEATLPGFVHDVGAAFFPFGKVSPAFVALGLSEEVDWLHAGIESCHPAPDGTVAAITRDLDRSIAHFGCPEDGARWRALATWHRGVEARLLQALLSTFPAVGPALALGPVNLWRLARMLTRSGAGLAQSLFRTEAARRVLPSLALHVDVAPGDRFGAGLGYMLGLTATTGGYPVPRGGAQTITNALVRRLEASGGRLVLGTRVRSIAVSGPRARGVVTEAGEQVPALRGVLADTSAATLLLELLPDGTVSRRVARAMRRFPHGWGTFKMDWALSGPVPWIEPLARESAVVHAADSLEDMQRFSDEVRGGALPSHPYLVIGQQSLVDPSRAPAGQHTLWAYSRVPSEVPGGWGAHGEHFADRVEARIEQLAPGFGARILARRIVTPEDLEAMDENLVGGDLGWGSNAWNRLLLFRPVFPYFRYRMPVRGVYLCSSYAHPGAGVHGMCGYNAALVAARDVE
jgi:phytoene dehydrogenase-like protein